MIQGLFVMKLWSHLTKTVPTYFNEKTITCETQNLYILQAILLAF